MLVPTCSVDENERITKQTAMFSVPVNVGLHPYCPQTYKDNCFGLHLKSHLKSHLNNEVRVCHALSKYHALQHPVKPNPEYKRSWNDHMAVDICGCSVMHQRHNTQKFICSRAPIHCAAGSRWQHSCLVGTWWQSCHIDTHQRLPEKREQQSRHKEAIWFKLL